MSDRRLNADIGGRADENEVFGAMCSENQIEVGADITVVTLFLYDNIAFLRFQLINDFGTPGSRQRMRAHPAAENKIIGLKRIG